MMTIDDTGAQSRSRKILWIFGWVAIGAAAGYFGAELFMSGGGEGLSVDLDLSAGLALALSAILALCSVIVAVGTLVPAAGISMKMFDDREQWEDEREMMWLSVFGCFAYGGLPAMLALAEPIGLASSPVLLAALVLIALLIVAASWRLFALYDELWRGVTAEMAALGFYMVFAIGGIWSAAAHLGYAPPLAPLDWLTLFTATTLVAAIVATHRRGMTSD